MTNLHVGQKVVCIGCAGTPKPPGYWEQWQKDWNVTLPQRGVVYTVRTVGFGPATGVCFIRVSEIINPIAEYLEGSMEPWFLASAFRPVVERNTDISIFTAMLHTQRMGVPA